jgi:prefoldin subunit 5
MDADVAKSIENIVAVLKSLDERTTSLESSVKEMESKLGKIVDALAAISTISSN